MGINDFDWKARYNSLHLSFPGYKEQPVIGITGNFGEKGCELAEGYYKSILEAGGTPFIIPPYEEKNALINTLNHLDGLLLSGGGDINPLFTGEEPLKELGSVNCKRDLAELLLIRLAADRQIPILGICRGIQMLSVALGGTVYQDIYSQQNNQKLIKHSQNLDRSYASHSIQILPDSKLRKIAQRSVWAVNSFHHQAVKDPGPELTACAHSCDGVIEAIESKYKSILGVQWHPECFILRNDTGMMPLFEWLIRESSSYKEAKRIHQRIISLDSHCDTPMFFSQQIQFHQRDSRILVDLHKMTEGHLDAAILAAYLEQKERTEDALIAATAKADRILTQIEKLAAYNCTAMEIAYTPADIWKIKNEGKKTVMLAIENGYAIGKDLTRLEHFRQRGVVYLTLCHNGDNDICDSAKGSNEHNGLSPFGQEVVREMNRLGMMVDLSHASEKTFYDTLEVSQVPVVCSHSSCKSLCNVPRNLTDEQLRALAIKGGVAQITLYQGFLRQDGKASIQDVIEHINHAVTIAGIDHVGIGTDFDGDGGIPGCASAAEIINITRCLLEERYSEADIQKLWGGNFLRVMSQVQSFPENKF